ncbi:hypothetical protein [Streptacidiphilus albus]|uniref:hypothetical protein n=1 Tax=Streptacidiphilus albus TaxID=105425 RepID=UPI000B1078AB|nr:hypothetical protein [Streptacidiphilus albus]
MVSVDSLLDEHEVAVRARIDGLREEAVRVTADLEEAERALAHVAITRATLGLVVAGRPVVVQAEIPATQSPAGTVGGGTACAVSLPPWREDLTVAALPDHYQRLWLALRDAVAPVRARELAVLLGLEPSASKVEGVRAKLKRLVDRGWAVEESAGVFRAGTGLR